MGSHSDSEREKDLREAYNGPVATAVPGYSLLDEKQPDGEPQPVIAWRIGRSWTLPVTTLGCMVGEHYVVQPDGRVARCFKSTVQTCRCSGKAWQTGSYGCVAEENHPPRHKRAVSYFLSDDEECKLTLMLPELVNDDEANGLAAT